MKRTIHMMVLCCLLSLPALLRAQVAPGDIQRSLLKESQEAVLGTDAEIDWQTVVLTAQQKEQLKGTLRMKRQVPDTLHIGRVSKEGETFWIIPDIAPSKSEMFSYVLYLNARKEIIDVDVLEYRENYGYEIDYSFFRKQFRGKSSPERIRFGSTIQNISGATISARSLTYSVRDLMNILSTVELQ